MELVEIHGLQTGRYEAKMASRARAYPNVSPSLTGARRHGRSVACCCIHGSSDEQACLLVYIMEIMKRAGATLWRLRALLYLQVCWIFIERAQTRALELHQIRRQQPRLCSLSLAENESIWNNKQPSEAGLWFIIFPFSSPARLVK